MSEKKSIRRRLITYLNKIAYPHYVCEDCVGAGKEHPCYCEAHEAVAPGQEPRMWHRFVRRLAKKPYFSGE